MGEFDHIRADNFSEFPYLNESQKEKRNQEAIGCSSKKASTGSFENSKRETIVFFIKFRSK